MQKRQFTAEYKTRIVLEVLREEKQLNELAKEHDISPNQLRNWKKSLLKTHPKRSQAVNRKGNKSDNRKSK